MCTFFPYKINDIGISYIILNLTNYIQSFLKIWLVRQSHKNLSGI